MKNDFRIKKINAKERVAIQNERNYARSHGSKLVETKRNLVTRIVHDPK